MHALRIGLYTNVTYMKTCLVKSSARWKNNTDEDNSIRLNSGHTVAASNDNKTPIDTWILLNHWQLIYLPDKLVQFFNKQIIKGKILITFDLI